VWQLMADTVGAYDIHPHVEIAKAYEHHLKLRDLGEALAWVERALEKVVPTEQRRGLIHRRKRLLGKLSRFPASLK